MERGDRFPLLDPPQKRNMLLGDMDFPTKPKKSSIRGWLGTTQMAGFFPKSDRLFPKLPTQRFGGRDAQLVRWLRGQLVAQLRCPGKVMIHNSVAFGSPAKSFKLLAVVHGEKKPMSWKKWSFLSSFMKKNNELGKNISSFMRKKTMSWNKKTLKPCLPSAKCTKENQQNALPDMA